MSFWGTMLEDLYQEIKQYLEKHNQNPTAPYHNNQHMLGAWGIAKQMWTSEKLRPDFCLVAPEEVMHATLMVAVLFHDFGHSGGVLSDRENIKIAIKELKRFVLVESKVLRTTFKNNHPDSMGYLLWGAVAIIDVTEFPFVKTPHGRLECIMRDVDILYAAMSGDPTVILDNLREEMQVVHGHALTHHTMLIGQEQFMKKATLFTETGKELWLAHAGKYLEQMKASVE